MYLSKTHCRDVLDAHWLPGSGYTRPNPARYPERWLWDSCFHALIWRALGDDRRALQEMRSVFRGQHASGFVPHVSYGGCASENQARMWSWNGTDYSCITQPPMYGHVLRVLCDAGLAVDELIDSAIRALRWLVQKRGRTGSRLLAIVHPSESGAGTSPRFDFWNATPRDEASWTGVKAALLRSVAVDTDGAGIGSSEFEVLSASFNALVAFNIAELVAVRPDAQLERAGREIEEELDDSWEPGLGTWRDTSVSREAKASVRTADALLVTLVSRNEAAVHSAFAALTCAEEFGAPFGVPSVSRSEASFDPLGYWRGSSWPPVNYLLWLAASRRRDQRLAELLRHRSEAGAERSRLSEYFDPLSGDGLGASPQTWGCLPLCMTETWQDGSAGR